MYKKTRYLPIKLQITAIVKVENLFRSLFDDFDNSIRSINEQFSPRFDRLRYIGHSKHCRQTKFTCGDCSVWQQPTVFGNDRLEKTSQDLDVDPLKKYLLSFINDVPTTCINSGVQYGSVVEAINIVPGSMCVTCVGESRTSALPVTWPGLAAVPFMLYI